MKTAILSLIIAVLVAILGAFQFDKYQKFIANTESFITMSNLKIDNRFAALEKKMDAQDSMLLEDINSLQVAGSCGIKSDHTASESGVASAADKTQALISEGAQDEWFINMAYRLVYLANTRLQMDQDVSGAMIYLQEADQALQSVQKVNVVNIQKDIKQKIELLNNLPELNIQQLWSTLGALITTVDTLPIQGMQKISTGVSLSHKTENSSVASSTDSTETSDKITWRNALNNTWQNIKDLVKIQRHTKPIEPLLSVEEQKLAHENVRLLLEQARWAVLHRNQIVYQQSLLDVKQALKNYFETKDELVQKFESAIDILAKIKLNRETVDLNPLLKLFPKTGDH